MDATIKRIIEEVVREMNLEMGFMLRVVELEESKAHLSRRHGIFDDLNEISRNAARRELREKEKAGNEN
jgi:hypothetical protein